MAMRFRHLSNEMRDVRMCCVFEHTCDASNLCRTAATSGQCQSGIGFERSAGEEAGAETWMGGGGDHGGVVGGEGAAGEKYFEARGGGTFLKCGAEFGVSGDPARHKDAFGGNRLRGGQGLVHQRAHDGFFEIRGSTRGFADCRAGASFRIYSGRWRERLRAREFLRRIRDARAGDRGRRF